MRDDQVNRRTLLGMLGGTLLAGPVAAAAEVATAPPVRVTLLGTAGGPPPHFGRSQPASLIEVDGKAYLIDAGENVAQQLLRAGVPSPKLNAAFLTHLHWDHTLGLDYLMASGWMMGRRDPLTIWGPPGTRDLVQRTIREVQLGEAIFRVQSPGRLPVSRIYIPREIERAGPTPVLDDGAVKVSAIENSHFALIRAPRHSYGKDRALSYRFDTAHGAVVFTGDTGPSPALVEFARGASILVSEIVDLASMQAALTRAGNSGAELATLMQHMEHQHLTPEVVGRMAAEAGVAKLVLTHYVIGPGFDPEAFVARIRPHFTGEIVVGSDLTRISLGG